MSWAQGKGGHAEATLGRGPKDLGKEAQSDLRRSDLVSSSHPTRGLQCAPEL